MIDTICALSTPQGRSALALIRISGPKTAEVVRDLAGKIPKTREATLCLLRSASGELIDEAVVTYFQAPNSYTGEDLAEISAHGNPIIVEQLLQEIVSRETRIAEGGEFTRRALANGKMSLDEVEALSWVLNATTSEGVRRGLRSKLQGLGFQVEKAADELREIITQMQAELDFSEEEVGQLEKDQLVRRAEALREQLLRWVKSFESSKHLLQRWVVAIVGPANSGKSSLFNALLGTSRSLVFDQPGTTRDLVEQTVEWDGKSITLIDTAGLREDPETIEKLGIEKTREAMQVADLICWVSDCGEGATADIQAAFAEKPWVFVNSKADLASRKSFEGLNVSVFQKSGLDELRERLMPPSIEADIEPGDAILTSNRQRERVSRAAELIRSGMRSLESGEYLDMVAERFLQAANALEDLIRPQQPEDVLRAVFSRFCIGK